MDLRKQAAYTTFVSGLRETLLSVVLAPQLHSRHIYTEYRVICVSIILVTAALNQE